MATARRPGVPEFAVRRERLVTLLDLAVQRRVTVVVAPPGYGKTVLVSQWAAAHPRKQVRWLTVGSGHDDAGRFLVDLCDALGASMRAPGSDLEAGSDLFAALRADLESAPPTTVVLDDFHRLSNRALLDEVGDLIEHLPRWIHVVLVTQVDPPLRYHRLRLADELVEVRQDDLAFRRGEAAELLRRLVPHALTARHIDALMARTEGWVVGLQLAAVSLRQRADVGRFVEMLAEDDRHVADYLTEQVLLQQPDEIRQFLLSTSVLERMGGPLCDAVTGGTGTQAMLDEVERRSLFITALDPRREWFRYHQLFRSLLRHHLRDEDPAREGQLLQRAGAWHLARGDLETGVDYLAQAGASEEILDAAFAYGGALVAQGRPLTVTRWIEQVPPSVRDARSHVMLLHAAASIMGGETAQAAEELDGVDALDSASSADRVVAELLRARSALHEGAAMQAITGADQVLREVATVDEAEMPNLLGLLRSRADVQAAARLTRGVALFHHGDLAAARLDLEAVLDGGHVVWEVYALGSLALVDAWSGRLSSARQLGARALSSALQLELDRRPFTVDAHLALATVARHREDLGEARESLEAAADRGTRSRHPVLASLVATERALVALAAGNPADGLAILGRLRHDAPTFRPHAVIARRQAAEARLRAMIGDIEGAQRALDMACNERPEVVAGNVRLAVERGDIPAARALVRRWPSGPEPRANIECQLWLAILDHIDGDETAAHDRFAGVLAQAELESDLGLFRTAGLHILGPARPLYRTDPSPFLRAIVHPPGAAAAPRLGAGKELVEPLTERESVLLGLLPTRLSNAEIASRLGVSLNTVKTHLKHMYRKLGVTGRSEAVASAERMGLV